MRGLEGRDLHAVYRAQGRIVGQALRAFAGDDDSLHRSSAHRVLHAVLALAGAGARRPEPVPARGVARTNRVRQQQSTGGPGLLRCPPAAGRHSREPKIGQPVYSFRLDRHVD